MAKNATEFEYTLIEPISIHKGGDLVNVNKLLLKAPTNAHRYHIIKLRQGYIKAQQDQHQFYMSLDIKKLQDLIKDSDKPKEKETKVEVKVVLELLYGSSIDMNEYMNTFKNLICDNLCLVDGTVKLTDHLFNQISINDCDQLLGKYFQSFMTSSWMSQ